MRKQLIVLMIHQLFWVGFSYVVFLSKRDQIYSKVILFLVFFYQLYLIAKYVGNTRKASIIITCFYASVFFFCQAIVKLF
ncbi:hypothetical protein [Bacillus sp. AFS041924]|uniref:hypothetical protein n=1 Tax=Bacillus sp. AFS041924 TaxID=2033503 RepID=UPI000BFDD285|nr:hypothetical protein [Bacillus sp. AFS041924]PGS53034.1 hypothetical protein COC46_08145 [Bacillus sp. AFS041924]